MFSAWNFHGWLASVGVVLFMGFLITSLSILATALVTRIWGAERDVAETPRASETAKKPAIREAA